MTVLRKAYPVSLRAVEGDGEGRVEALVSIFGNVDYAGDRVVKGAFAKSIAKWQESGNPVPVIFSHDWGDVWSHIGAVEELEETEKGLRAVYTLDIADNPTAAQVHRLMKRGTLKEHSFGYLVAEEATAKDGANELLELDLIEIGPTLKGANPDTVLVAVKSELAKIAREKRAIGRHTTATSDAAWDGPGNQARLSNDAGAATYRQAYAWQDPDADPDTKAAWKFPHHFVAEDGTVGAASTRGCSAGIAVLNGGRGGAAIPDADRQGVYNHLAGHLRDADLDVPELASMPAKSVGVKAGRVLSKANEAKLRGAVEALTQVLSSLAGENEKPDEAETGGKTVDEAEGKPTVEAEGKASDTELLSYRTAIESLKGAS